MFGLSKVEKIKRQLPILDFIQGQGVALKKNGSGWVGCCPFHEDRTPSLHVSPDKGLWNCFGCQKGGDVITFYQHLKGVDNKAAIEALSQLEDPRPGAIAPSAAAVAVAPALSREQERGGDALPPASAATTPTAPAASGAALLGNVCRLYHEAFLRSPEAQRYLEGRGLKTKELWRRFQIGYCAGGDLKKAIKEGSPTEALLKGLGILNDRNNESFYKCLTFPLLDRAGAVVGLYGRSIEGKRHLYLKGRHQGLFNAPVAKGSAGGSVILTESILDALSLIELGILNVLPLYGTQGFTDDHRAFLRSGAFQEIILCLDSDESGRQAAARLAPEILPLTARIAVLDLPAGHKDPNDFLTSGGTRDVFQAVLSGRRVLPSAEPEATLTPTLSRERERGEDGPAPVPVPTTLTPTPAPAPTPRPAGLEFRLDPVLYKVKGASTITEDSMRVVVTAELGDKFFRDRVDLYSARARSAFAIAAAAKLGLQEGRLEDDLQRLSVLLEALPRPRGNQAAVPGSPELSAGEKQEAIAFLKRPDLLRRIVQDISATGYVGQDNEKLLLYLSATSRILPKPIHVSLRSTSSSGKSELMEKVVALFPPEAVEFYSRISAQSLYYMENLRHKIMILDEKSGAEDGAETALRSLMSRGRLSLAVVQRDPQTGISKTVDIELEGPCVVWDSSTEGATEDNQNRVFELWLNESREQTRLIHEAQRAEFSPDSHQHRQKAERIRRLHQNAQRLLRPLSVVIPFRHLLDFPDHLARAHRDHQRLLSLLAVIALLHQHQREVRTGPDGAGYIEATAEDYAAAWQMTEPVFRVAYAHVPRDAKDLFGLIHAEVAKLAQEQGLQPAECSFSRREVREWSSWSESKARRCLCDLMRMEYLTPILATRGRIGYLYRLCARPEDLEASIQKFTTPEGLLAKISAQNRENRQKDP